MNRMPLCALLGTVLVCQTSAHNVRAETAHVWEKVEITLQSQRHFENPYTDVQVWVDLKGPDFDKRCYGFWDGGSTFRVRVLATAPGVWTWQSGASVDDPGLRGVRGAFTAVAWTAAALEENCCRRGMIRPSSNGHAFEHADGTPFFLLGDTWWATPTFRFHWYDDDTPRPLGPSAGFKDYVRFRRQQQYNCIAMIAAFPNWANDGKPARWKTQDGMVLRWAWPQAGTDSAKDMSDEAGRRAFAFPGAVPGYEEYFPDVNRMDPEYFRSMDRKVDYLNAQGMVPFIEVARRDVGQAWKRYYPWPDSYARYVQYVWSRYQANICLFSPIHFDTPAQSIGAEDWNAAANLAIDRYGHPPFGTLAGTNSNPSSLENWGHTDRARWLGFHQIGNHRTHDVYERLTEIFRAKPPVPGINGEPYYDGMLDAEPGSDKAARYCRSAMYGSVLSGGLGGHIYGAGGWKGGLWSGEVEAASEYPIWKVIQWPSADEMRHLKTFVLSEGRRYQDLVPSTELLSPNRSGDAKSLDGWAYCAATASRDLVLLYFEQDCPQATLSGVPPGWDYQLHWYDPPTGHWLDASTTSKAITVAADGTIRLPAFPDGKAKSDTDWALKLRSPSPWELHGRLSVSDDGHSLEHADGTPFFWLGDTVWALHQNLSREDVKRYLDDAAAAGFNVIQLMSVNAWALDNWRNFYGATPYLDDSAARLNPPFWEHLGWVIDEAAARGLFVLLVYGSPGRTDNHGAVTHTPAEAYAYGHALGALYRDKPNLIWSSGIDVNPDDPRRVSPMGMAGWHAMAEGVADGVNGVQNFDGRADWTSTLMTYHPRGGNTSSTWFHDAPWLDFNGAQVGWRGSVLLKTLDADYARKPPKPIVDIEPWYERCTWKTPPVDAWEVRMQAYQSVFAGACGHTYGHNDIWPLDSPGPEYGKRWRQALAAPGRMQMRYLRRLMESQPQAGRVPLPKLVARPDGGAGTSLVLNERIATTGGADGSWAFVYTPHGASFSVDLALLKGQRFTASWFDPRTGEFQPLGAVDNGRRQVFDPPGEPGRGNDWVLALACLRP